LKTTLEAAHIQTITTVEASAPGVPSVSDGLPKEKTIKEMLEERETELKEMEQL